MSSYFGLNNVAVKAKNAHIGVKNISKKILKMYIGVNGVAKLFFGAFSSGSHSSAENIGEAPLLSKGVRNNTATSISKYAIFAGGYDPLQVATYDIVDAYDISITKYESNLSNAVYGLASGTFNNKAIFGGGKNTTYGVSPTLCSAVDSFDVDLVKTPLEDLDVARFYLSCGTVGDYLLFVAGATTTAEDTLTNLADAYDKDLTKVYVEGLEKVKKNVPSANTANHIFFSGGDFSSDTIISSRCLTVDTYDTSLTVQHLGDLGTPTYAGFTINEQAIFVGDNLTWIFDDSLTKTYIYTSTSLFDRHYTSVSVGDCAIICDKELVYFYDSDLTRTQIDSLVEDRSYMAGTSIGDYILIGGGCLADDVTLVSQTVDVYKLN